MQLLVVFLAGGGGQSLHTSCQNCSNYTNGTKSGNPNTLAGGNKEDYDHGSSAGGGARWRRRWATRW